MWLNRLLKLLRNNKFYLWDHEYHKHHYIAMCSDYLECSVNVDTMKGLRYQRIGKVKLFKIPIDNNGSLRAIVEELERKLNDRS